MKTYLITGSSGFVGGALTRKLLTFVNTRVVALERDGDAASIQPYTSSKPVEPETVHGDIEDLRTCERIIAEYQPDVIFHLAAQAIVGTAKRDPIGTLETNVRGTYNMLEAFRRCRKDLSSFIVASSDKAYGETKVYADGRAPYEETDPLEGRGIYDVSKSCADLIAQSYARQYGLKIGIARAGNIYGPGDRDKTRIIPSIMDDIYVGRDPLIRSDGTPVRDYLFIDDAVSAYLSLEDYMVFNPGGAFNFAGGEPITVFDLTKLALKICGKEHLNPRILGERTDEIQHQVLDTKKAREVLSWSPKFKLSDGIMKTWIARRS